MDSVKQGCDVMSQSFLQILIFKISFASLKIYWIIAECLQDVNRYSLRKNNSMSKILGKSQFTQKNK